MQDWLTVKAAKEKYNVSKPTLYRWIKSGKITSKVFGTNLRISRTSLENMLALTEQEKVKGHNRAGKLYIIKSSQPTTDEKQTTTSDYSSGSAMEIFEYKNGMLSATSFTLTGIACELETTEEMFASIGFKDYMLYLYDNQDRTLCEVFGKDNKEFFALIWLSETLVGIYINGLIEYINFLKFIQPVLELQKGNKN